MAARNLFRVVRTITHQRRFSTTHVSLSSLVADDLQQVEIPEHKSENPQPIAFPCLDAAEERSMDGGPEPMYDRVVSGYQTFQYNKPFRFFYGGQLSAIHIAYETWGQLNEKRNNAILIHTGLSASSHAKSHEANTKPGWWEKFIGPGLSIDTNKFFVICTNVLGGCYGSTGPSSVNPKTNQPYATTFPILSLFDMVRSQFLLLDSLGIQTLHASVGASLGGMQSLAAAALFPDRVGRFVSISGAARSIPYSIALRYTQRRVLMNDPNYNKGYYYNSQFPFVGMKLAREIATISYRSGPEWDQRFGRKRLTSGRPSFCPDFLIETYLDHQSERFCLQYDPNSLLYISKAMDLFDLSISSSPTVGEQTSSAVSQSGNACAVPVDLTAPQATSLESAGIQSDFEAGMARIKAPALIIGVQSDLLFPVTQQREIAAVLRKQGNKIVRYYELDALYGHDTFLIDVDTVGTVMKGHLEDELIHAQIERPSTF